MRERGTRPIGLHKRVCQLPQIASSRYTLGFPEMALTVLRIVSRVMPASKASRAASPASLIGSPLGIPRLCSSFVSYSNYPPTHSCPKIINRGPSRILTDLRSVRIGENPRLNVFYPSITLPACLCRHRIRDLLHTQSFHGLPGRPAVIDIHPSSL